LVLLETLVANSQALEHNMKKCSFTNRSWNFILNLSTTLHSELLKFLHPNGQCNLYSSEAQFVTRAQCNSSSEWGKGGNKT